MKLVFLVVVLGCICVKSTTGQGAPQMPGSFTATSTATSISLSWTQSSGDSVDSYKITYSYTINQCDGVEGDFPSVTIPISNGTHRSYEITNSPSTPVEEDSMYSIELVAISNGTESNPSNTRTDTQTAAPRPPPSLAASSVTISSITIQWDPILCQDRNQQFNSYAVNSFPSSNPNIMSGVGLVPETDRAFTASSLSPRTSYTFQVQAFNLFPSVQGLFANLTVNTSAPTNLGFLLGGQLYGNNSVVTVTDIGSSFFMSALFCLTPSLECCSDSETPNAASVTREWYLPDGTPVPSAVFSREQVSSAVALYRSGGTSPSGVFRCEIPDASGTSQNIYIGIYPQGDGSPVITSLLFDRNSTTLTCTSTGGPPTTVTWRKNSQPINQTFYEQSQRLVDAERATYENILFDDNIASFVGSFTCEVSNIRGVVEETVELNGVSIIRDQFSVGDSATASCRSDNEATRMEWLSNGTVVATAMSTQQLDLEFSLVNDSIHNQVYICRVTREADVQVEQNFTVQVNVPRDAITASVSTSGTARAGMPYNLTCNVSKTVDGLFNFPTATWTTTEGTPISGEEVTEQNMAYAISILTFDPLRTSHEGNYRCGGTLTSPALEADLTDFSSEQLSVQISTPDVDITVSPGPLFAGRIAPLTLTCTISINPATDVMITTATVDVSWSDNVGSLSNGSRMTISPLSGSGLSYTSTLTISPPNIADSTFFCIVGVRPPLRQQTFITRSNERSSRIEITVIAPNSPTVSIVPSSDSAMAGNPLSLTCSATVQEGISGTPTFSWSRDDGALPDDVDDASPLLSFPSLHTSHGGGYTCTARLSIPEAGVNVFDTNSVNVSVQIPQPSVTITGSPRNMTFLPGLLETFTCVVAVHPAVDTPVMVQGNWERNGTQLRGSDDGRVSVTSVFETVAESSGRYQITITFNPMTIDDNGIYRCPATVTPQMSEFVSEHASLALNLRRVDVQALPPPTITVASRQPSADGCGEARIINCTTELMDGFIATPSISWVAPDGVSVATEGNSNPRVDDQTKQLIFRDISAASPGEYSCRLNIGSNFEAFTRVSVGSGLPGTLQTLMCINSRGSDLALSWIPPTSQRSEIVGYRVDVKQLAHRDGTREVVQSEVVTFTTTKTEANITQGLAAEVPYNITVKALNLAGCGEEQQIYCFTQEGQELPTPENVVFVKSDTTSIDIGWKLFTLVELKALANYTVTYSAASTPNIVNTISVPWTENSITITNLNSGTRYDITVSITTPSRMSAQAKISASTPSPSQILPIIIGVVVPLVIILLVILMVIILIVIVVQKKRRATVKLQQTRMLRAFEQPADIMLTSKEKNLEEKEEEVTTSNELPEKPPPTITGECELVQSPVHVPTTFAAPKEESVKNSTIQANGNGQS